MYNKIVVLGNGTDWCGVMLGDMKKYNVKVINSETPIINSRSLLLKFFLRLHFSKTINDRIRLPLKRVWFKKIAKNIDETFSENLTIIIYDRNKLANNRSFLNFLRKKYRNCKLIYMFTNITERSGAAENGFVDELKDNYDLIYTFDLHDAEKYEYKYAPLMYSLRAEGKGGIINTDLFYVGKAKDRLSLLLEIFGFLKKRNISNEFHIFGVEASKQKYKTEIVYNRLMPYIECLRKLASSKAILDIIQSKSEGFTLRVCEAIFYNKILITTNKRIVEAPFYDKRYMHVINSASDIKKEWFQKKDVRYSANAKYFFSVDKFLLQLADDLKNIR